MSFVVTSPAWAQRGVFWPLGVPSLCLFVPELAGMGSDLGDLLLLSATAEALPELRAGGVECSCSCAIPSIMLLAPERCDMKSSYLELLTVLPFRCLNICPDSPKPK